MKRLLLALFACVIVAACGGGASVNSPDPIMHNAQAQVAPVGPWTYIEPINGAKPPVCDPTRDFIQVEPNGLNWCVKAFFYPVLGVSMPVLVYTMVLKCVPMPINV